MEILILIFIQLFCVHLCVSSCLCVLYVHLCAPCACIWGIWKKSSVVFFYFSLPYFLKTDSFIEYGYRQAVSNTSDTVSDPSPLSCSHGWNAWHLLLRNQDLNSDPCYTASPVISPDLNVKKFKGMMSRNWRNSLFLVWS